MYLPKATGECVKAGDWTLVFKVVYCDSLHDCDPKAPTMYPYALFNTQHYEQYSYSFV